MLIIQIILCAINYFISIEIIFKNILNLIFQFLVKSNKNISPPTSFESDQKNLEGKMQNTMKRNKGQKSKGNKQNKKKINVNLSQSCSSKTSENLSSVKLMIGDKVERLSKTNKKDTLLPVSKPETKKGKNNSTKSSEVSTHNGVRNKVQSPVDNIKQKNNILITKKGNNKVIKINDISAPDQAKNDVQNIEAELKKNSADSIKQENTIPTTMKGKKFATKSAENSTPNVVKNEVQGFVNNIKQENKKGNTKMGNNITKQVTLKPPSLSNIGATCYLNSAIQGISSCNTFVKEISEMSERYKISGLEFLPVFKQLIDILNGCSRDQMEISRNAIFCNWNKTGHQDSYELLAHVINQVYNEIRQYEEKIRNIAKRDLHGWLKKELPMRIIMEYIIECDCKLVMYSPIQSDLALHVTIPLNNESSKLNDLIDLYFDRDSVEDFVCDRPGCSERSAFRSIKLSKPLPNTVCIHLQRTNWNGYEMKKINKKIQFDMSIVLKSKYWSEKGTTKGSIKRKSTDKLVGRLPKLSKTDLEVEERSGTDLDVVYDAENISDDLVYHLKSVIVHSGTVSCGHYICYKRLDHGWYLTNDSMIQRVDDSEVLNCQAYIMFYERPYLNGN